MAVCPGCNARIDSIDGVSNYRQYGAAWYGDCVKCSGPVMVPSEWIKADRRKRLFEIRERLKSE